MEYLYGIMLFISLLLGIVIGLKLPFISDKLGKVIIREYSNDNIRPQTTVNNLTPDLIDEWQNGGNVNE